MTTILRNLVIRTHPHDEASAALAAVTAAVTLADATGLRCHFEPATMQSVLIFSNFPPTLYIK